MSSVSGTYGMGIIRRRHGVFTLLWTACMSENARRAAHFYTLYPVVSCLRVVIYRRPFVEFLSLGMINEWMSPRTGRLLMLASKMEFVNHANV